MGSRSRWRHEAREPGCRCECHRMEVSVRPRLRDEFAYARSLREQDRHVALRRRKAEQRPPPGPGRGRPCAGMAMSPVATPSPDTRRLPVVLQASSMSAAVAGHRASSRMAACSDPRMRSNRSCRLIAIHLRHPAYASVLRRCDPSPCRPGREGAAPHPSERASYCLAGLRARGRFQPGGDTVGNRGERAQYCQPAELSNEIGKHQNPWGQTAKPSSV